MMARIHPNNQKLRRLMTQHGLSRREVSLMLRKAVTGTGRTPAVDKWLASPGDSQNFRRMPDLELEVLELKLHLRSMGGAGEAPRK